MNTNLVVIGKIVAPHGVRGELRIIPLTDFPDRFSTQKTVLLADGSSLHVESARNHKNFVLLKFRGINTMDEANLMRGKLIHVDRSNLVPLPEGHYYQFEIIGLTVHTETGEYLGKVADILTTGSNDVYVVEQEGQKPVLVPALKEVVLNIDTKNGQMTVKLQEEWE